MQNRHFLTTFTFLLTQYLAAQPTRFPFLFDRIAPMPVFDTAGMFLQAPWNGGATCNQFFNMDVNGDGSQDIVSFEKQDSILSVFLHKNSSGQTQYEYAPQYQKFFPFVQDWVDLADYDGDGRLDLFTNNNGETKLYRNTTPAGNAYPVFTLKTAAIPVKTQFSPFPTNMYVNATDNAEVVDIDGDGDVDVLAWEIFSPSIVWYKNLSMERYNRRDTLDFLISSSCWGRFQESFTTNDLRLCLDANCFRDTTRSCPCGLRAQEEKPEKTTHSGGTLTIFDQNKDGKFDLLLSDISYPNLIFIQNSALTGIDSMGCGLDTSFPNYQVPYKGSIFPHASRLDVNGDGKMDLVVNPFDNKSKHYNSRWYYENTSASPTSAETFTLQETNWFPASIFDLPWWSAPALMDYDRDGDLDAFIFTQNANNKAAMQLLEHTAVGYRWVDTNYSNFIQQTNKKNLTPTFGDLNGDSIPDLLAGNSSGVIEYYTGAWVGGKIQFTLQADTFQNIQYWYDASPQLVDVDRDGLFDLISGDIDGHIFYYRNQGSRTTPIFLANSPDTLGGLDLNGIFPAKSVPRLADFNADGKWDLAVGEMGGKLILFDNIFDTVVHRYDSVFYYSNALGGASVDVADFGDAFRMTVVNWNGDSLPDLMLGTNNGGIMALRNRAGSLNTVNLSKTELSSLAIYPNPATDRLEILQPDGPKSPIFLYGLTGQMVKTWEFPLGVTAELEVGNLPEGLYLVQWKNQRAKLLIQHLN
jgi:hypothetical protein